VQPFVLSDEKNNRRKFDLDRRSGGAKAISSMISRKDLLIIIEFLQVCG